MTLQQPHLLIKHVETVERNVSQKTDEADILFFISQEKKKFKVAECSCSACIALLHDH